MDPLNLTAGDGLGGGVEMNPQDNTKETLFTGIDTGFSNVMKELLEIRQQMQTMPGKTAEALSEQLQNGSIVKAGDEKGQDAAENSKIVNDLMDKNERLESEKSQLEYRIQVADQMVSALNLRESEQKNRLFELKRDIARLEKKETEFRDIIISNVATQQVTDQDVIQAFSELRQTVQQLAKNQAFDLIQNPLLPTPDAKNQANKHFYTIIRDLSPKDVSFRVRMRIWEILYRFIFSRTIFGLKGDYDHDKESQDMWDIETHLVRFEEYLSKNSKVKDSMVSNWRIYTLQCIGAMEIPERLSDYVADKLEVCFMPLISKRATNEQKDELWDKMLDVCRKAVAVKLMMQRSKEGYNITTIDLKDHPLYSKTGHLAESMGVEGGKTPDASDSIAYVLFGALIKHPMNNGGENKVLLKAEIILKKMSRV